MVAAGRWLILPITAVGERIAQIMHRFGACRAKSADIYDKFRRGSQLQNYILSLHNFSSFSSIQRRLFDDYSLIMHFIE